MRSSYLTGRLALCLSDWASVDTGKELLTSDGMLVMGELLNSADGERLTGAEPSARQEDAMLREKGTCFQIE